MDYYSGTRDYYLECRAEDACLDDRNIRVLRIGSRPPSNMHADVLTFASHFPIPGIAGSLLGNLGISPGDGDE